MNLRLLEVEGKCYEVRCQCWRKKKGFLPQTSIEVILKPYVADPKDSGFLRKGALSEATLSINNQQS
jgi:hypothetical protein